jgi:hypothetical protein
LHLADNLPRRPLARRQVGRNSRSFEDSGHTVVEGQEVLNVAECKHREATDVFQAAPRKPSCTISFLRRLLDEAEDGFNQNMGIKPMNRAPTEYRPAS